MDRYINIPKCYEIMWRKTETKTFGPTHWPDCRSTEEAEKFCQDNSPSYYGELYWQENEGPYLLD